MSRYLNILIIAIVVLAVVASSEGQIMEKIRRLMQKKAAIWDMKMSLVRALLPNIMGGGSGGGSPFRNLLGGGGSNGGAPGGFQLPNLASLPQRLGSLPQRIPGELGNLAGGLTSAIREPLTALGNLVPRG